MTEILNDALNLMYVYNFTYNCGDDKIDNKQFARELRSVYSLSEYESLYAGIIDDILERIGRDCIKKTRSEWLLAFVLDFAD